MIGTCQILLTTAADLDVISALFESAISYQKENNYPVWDVFTTEALLGFIERRCQYKVLIDGEIALVFNAEYSDTIIWRQHDQSNAVYLHQIVTNPKFKGQKLFGLVSEWAISHAKEKKLPFVRLDTWGSNTQLIQYYQSFGYRFVEFFTTPRSAEIPPYYWDLELALFEMSIE